MAQAFITQNVVQAVAQSVVDKQAKIIDISCGFGDILKGLQSKGFTNLHGSNHSGYPPLPEDIQVTTDVDLLEGLPFDDDEFDVVVCSEVLEHVCNHIVAIYELVRILKPGGLLFVSTPNMLRIRSRLSFLFSGFHNRKHRFVRYNIPLHEYYRAHNFVLEFPMLHYFLTAAGTQVEQIFPSRIKPISIPFFLLSYPFVALSTFLQLKVWDRDSQQRPYNNELLRFLLSPHIQASEVVILRARKM